MIRWLAVVWRLIWSLVSRVIWALVSRPAEAALEDSETEQGPLDLPSPITRHKDGEGAQEEPLSWTSSPIQKLNDHIYELYKPNGEPAMEILFFHGLQFGHSGDAYLSTWTTGDGSRKVWPGTWLAEKFPNARILSVSYDSSVWTTPVQGRLDLFQVAENLIQAICWANIGQGNCRPVILVGYSFGGLVMKQLCVEADRKHGLDPNSEGNLKIGKFLRNIGGLFFYGTPHRGIHLPPLVAHFLDSPLIDYMKLLSAEGARLETIFNAVCKKYKIWHIASVGESQETSWGPLHLLVVPEASARYNTDFCTVPADHISICKPADQTSNSFQRLINFIPKVEGGARTRFDNHQIIPKAAVGLDGGVEVVCKILQENARVGIHGMGGVGKTTLAMAVFNELGPTFEYSCFCPEVKLMKGTLDDVKNKIWEHMCWDGKKGAEKDPDWSKLRGKRLLLVLDDVARDIDLQVLLQVASLVAAESRFILTSRDKELLNDSDDIELYQVPFLSEKDAKLLFLSYAFKNQARPPLALESHIDVVIMKCEGLPLALEVLGKYLKDKRDGEFWKQSIEVLRQAESVSKLNDRLWEKLRLSYNGLPEKEQQMFLDATTFFSYSDNQQTSYAPKWTLRDAKAVWSVSYGRELLRWQSLVDASLVYDVKDHDQIKVHEQLRSFGRKIASDNANKDGRRVWGGFNELNLLQLTDGSNVQEIHSLRLEGPGQDQLDPINIPMSSLLRFKRLQYLDVGKFCEVSRMVSINGAHGNEIFHTDLVLLRSPNLQFAQLHFDLALLQRLAILELTNYRQQFLPNSIGQLSKLKILKIHHASMLETLPSEIGYLSKLEHLQLKDCKKVTTLPKSFGSLSALNHLDFYKCTNLHTLPESFGSLSALNYLDFYECYNLHTLPESFGSLSAVNHLGFSYCKNLHTLPESFGSLSALNHLEFYFCDNLRTLPESFGSLSALNHLEFTFCGDLHTLPESFGSLSALNHLKIFCCKNLHTLPESFGSLSALNHLEFYNCGNLHTLPESFGSLSALNHLEISRCENLRTLPESFGSLSALYHFGIHYWPIVTLPEYFGGLCALNHVDISNCLELRTLPDSFGQLSALNRIVIRGCPELRTLPDSFGGLSAHLEYLELDDCRKLERLPDSFSDLKALRHFRINLIALTSIPDCIKGFQALQILDLGSLPYLKGLPPWLGETLLSPPVVIFQKFFRAQDGHFSSKDLKQNSSVHFGSDWDVNRVKQGIWIWLHANAMDKAKALDYAGALASLGAVNGLDHRLDIGVHRRLFILRERCIIKRDMGDLQGALEELNLGFEEKRGPEWEKEERGLEWEREREKEKRILSCYGLFKHRSFVKTLLGDDEGARDDGEEALKWQPRRLVFSWPEPSLEDQSLTYLNFKLPGCKEMEDQEKLMNLKMKSSFEKLRATDFGGALVDLNTVDDGLLWPAERGFFLRERGVLKRLTGDLGGALEDLNTALEVYSKYDKDDYQCWRHRGYIKRLLGDIDGARMDAQKAWEVKESDKTNDSEDSWNDSEDSSTDTEELEESNLNDSDGKCSVWEQAASEERLLEIDPVDFSFRDPPVYIHGVRKRY